MTRLYFHENDEALKITVDTLPDVTRSNPSALLPVTVQNGATIPTDQILAAIATLPESDLKAIREAIDKRFAHTC